MHLDFTDEQLELRDAARSALARDCPPRLVATVARGGPGQDELTSALRWLGWPALAIDVDLGGLGRSFVELAVVLEEMGRAAAPGPFLPTQTQFVPLVREAGTPAQVHRFLADVASGGLHGTVALDEGSRWDPAALVATAERDGDGWLLRGRKEHVLGAPDLDEVVVAARRDSGTLGLFVVPAAELTFKRTDSLDATRSLANVELNGVWVPDARLLGDPGVDAAPALTTALAEATVALALDGLGACDALLDSSLDVTREWLGARRDGQATEHALADMLVAVETARALVYQATAAVAERHADAPRTASAAKAAVGACQRHVTAATLEIHGQAAARSERDLRLWIGRAKADDLLLGTATDHRRIVADHAFSARRPRPSPLAALTR